MEQKHYQASTKGCRLGLRRAAKKPSKKIILRPRNIFIFPSRRGLLCIATIVIIWLLGTNYQNNLTLALAYLLAVIFFLAIFETFKNLNGVQVELLNIHNNYLGSQMGVTLRISSLRKAHHHNVKLGFSRYQLVSMDILDQPVEQTLWWESYKRGFSAVPPIRIWSRYPLRLFHAWTWFKCDAAALTYPKPLHQVQVYQYALTHSPHSGAEEFENLREYRPGDSLKQIAWKHYAKSEQLLTQQYLDTDKDNQWLELNHSFNDLETALSHLCYWVINYSDNQRRFGVLLPGETIPINSGEAHRHAVLARLAMYQQPSITSQNYASKSNE
jgi:uncharacterized protein (DUF58 family)